MPVIWHADHEELHDGGNALPAQYNNPILTVLVHRREQSKSLLTLTMTMISTEADHNNEGETARVALLPDLLKKFHDGAQPWRINERGEAQESHGDGWGIKNRDS